MKKYFVLSSLCIALLLSACGFKPIYGERTNTNSVIASLNNIKINNIRDENGLFLRNKLIDRLYYNGRPQKPKAQLSVHLYYTKRDTGIKKDATSTRSQLRIKSNFVLSTIKGKTLLKGTATTTASYNKLDAQYGTLATERDAYKRALIEISEQIVNRLSLFYAEKAPFEKSK